MLDPPRRSSLQRDRPDDADAAPARPSPRPSEYLRHYDLIGVSRLRPHRRRPCSTALSTPAHDGAQSALGTPISPTRSSGGILTDYRLTRTIVTALCTTSRDTAVPARVDQLFARMPAGRGVTKPPSSSSLGTPAGETCAVHPRHSRRARADGGIWPTGSTLRSSSSPEARSASGSRARPRIRARCPSIGATASAQSSGACLEHLSGAATPSCAGWRPARDRLAVAVVSGEISARREVGGIAARSSAAKAPLLELAKLQRNRQLLPCLTSTPSG